MKRSIFVLLLIFFILPMVNAEVQTLGTFKQGDCINLIQTCSNCTYANITSILSPNSTIITTDVAMTKIGTNYNYTLCNTTSLGEYIVNGIGDLDGLSTIWSYNFLINGSGQNVSQSQVILILIGLTVVFIFALFFFVLSLLFKHPGPKIFFMSLSSITLIILIGIITANATTYLAEFPSIILFYNSYYYVMISFAGAAMLGLMVWLIYYSFTLFNKSRGSLPED